MIQLNLCGYIPYTLCHLSVAVTVPAQPALTDSPQSTKLKVPRHVIPHALVIQQTLDRPDG